MLRANVKIEINIWLPSTTAQAVAALVQLVDCETVCDRSRMLCACIILGVLYKYEFEMPICKTHGKQVLL